MSGRTIAQSMGLALDAARGAMSRLWVLEARLRGVRIRGSVRLMGRPIISVAANSQLSIDAGVQLNSSLRANPLGCFQPCVLRTLAEGALLELGPGVGLSAAVVCAGLEVRIGEGTNLGVGAMILDNDFHSPCGQWSWDFDCRKNAKPIRIGRGCFIGARAIVLKGVTIGDRAVIGAGAVVTQDVPPHSFAVGNPARILPPREPKV